jgi:antirestriction protein
MPNDTPKVWIGCLAAYNGGSLHGKWVDATDVDGIREAGAEVIKTSPADFPEELFIADYDGFPSDVVRAFGEYPDYDTVAKVATALEVHGAPFSAWLSIDYRELASDDLVSQFEESYRGEYESERDFAYQYLSDCGWQGLETIPDAVMSYLDMDMIVRDLFQHGPYSYVDGYVFEDV